MPCDKFGQSPGATNRRDPLAEAESRAGRIQGQPR
jgi:hypothetical protein